MRVLLGADHEPTERALLSAGHEVEVAQYREAVASLADRFRPEVAVLSCDLPGGTPVEDLVWALRLGGARVVLLCGKRTRNDPALRAAFSMGVYDFVFDPASPQDVVARVKSPASMAEAARTLGMKAPVGASREPERSGPLVVGTWSPAACGKTFVAVNLACVLAGGRKVLLAGLDGSGDLAVHLGLEALSGEPREVPGVSGLWAAEFGTAALAREAASDLGAGALVLDPFEGAEGRVLVVCDPDYARLLRVRKQLPQAGGRDLLLVCNRWRDLRGVPLDPGRVLGMQVRATFPDDPSRVLASVAEGRPVVLSHEDWRGWFTVLGEAVLV
ncbi:MAG: hypothetical protein AB1816_03795 [Bacillota bacterium]